MTTGVACGRAGVSYLQYTASQRAHRSKHCLRVYAVALLGVFGTRGGGGTEATKCTQWRN